MKIKKLIEDVFKKIGYLDENLENPFLNQDNTSNPFARFYNGTYIWVEHTEKDI